MDETKAKVPLKAISLKRLARIYSARGNHKEAIKRLTEALKYDAEDNEPLRLRGIEFQRLQNYKQALADFSEAIETAPDTTANYELRASLYDKLGETNLAKKDRREGQRLHDVPAEKPVYDLKGADPKD